jgi:hypothetical protein
MSKVTPQFYREVAEVLRYAGLDVPSGSWVVGATMAEVTHQLVDFFAVTDRGFDPREFCRLAGVMEYAPREPGVTEVLVEDDQRDMSGRGNPDLKEGIFPRRGERGRYRKG